MEISKNDISYERAKEAHNWTSMTPEVRAEQERPQGHSQDQGRIAAMKNKYQTRWRIFCKIHGYKLDCSETMEYVLWLNKCAEAYKRINDTSRITSREHFDKFLREDGWKLKRG